MPGFRAPLGRTLRRSAICLSALPKRLNRMRCEPNSSKWSRTAGNRTASSFGKWTFQPPPPHTTTACVHGASQSGGGRPISVPLLVYRVYPDGKEELIRGLRLRGLSVRSLKDIVAVSDESYVFHYLNTLAPMSMPGTGYVAPTSVVAPALLLEDVELERPQEELPKLPVVPPRL